MKNKKNKNKRLYFCCYKKIWDQELFMQYPTMDEETTSQFLFLSKLKSNRLFHSEEIADKYFVQVTIGLEVINFNFEI